MDLPKDDLKWFGEGFDGFPRRLPENCVEYALYIIEDKTQTESEIRTRLGQVLTAANDLTSKHLKDYVWQRDDFTLQLLHETDTPYLHGRTDHGDSIEDEWLIVYLLREVSKLFDDLWVRAFDTDGEFLLIEAANALPAWLNPEIADNRVWINNGGLFIIPTTKGTSKSTVDSANPTALSPQQARSFIATNTKALLHSPLIEEEAFYRLRNYPSQIEANLHHAAITVPRRLAHIIRQQPTTVSQAIEAFYLRDPIALRPLQSTASKVIDELHFPPRDLVNISVTFSKVGYAQLKSQQFTVPAWESALPDQDKGSDYSRAELGMKLSCGFEMLITDPQNRERDSVKKVQQLLVATSNQKIPLPTDEEISSGSLREDDESWLDINFEDFEKELSGRSKGKGGSSFDSGFGDKNAQENLQKMVERFGNFLNDDSAGIGGAEFHDVMDEDNDDDENDYSDVTSEGEDKDVSFDETEFARVMREMMGMPPEDTSQSLKPDSSREDPGVEELSSGDEDEYEDRDGEKMREVMRRMEAELNESGALNLDPTPKKIAATRTAIEEDPSSKLSRQAKEHSLQHEKDEDDDEDEDDEEQDGEELDIDYNLAKNMLESFKGQAGMAGPGGNLLGLMGMQFPRDEGETSDKDKR